MTRKIAKVVAVFIVFYLMLREFDGGPSVDDDQGSPTISAPGTGFREDNFSMDPEGLEMVQVTMGVMGSRRYNFTPSLAAHLLLYGPVPNSYITYLRWCLPACLT